MQQSVEEGETTYAMEVKAKILEEMAETNTDIQGYFLNLKNKQRVFVGKVLGGWFIKLTGKKKKEEFNVTSAGMGALLKVIIANFDSQEQIKLGKELISKMDAKTLDSFRRKVKKLCLKKRVDIQITDATQTETESEPKEKPETSSGES